MVQSRRVKCNFRLFDSNSGHILIDNVDLKSIDPSFWRQQIGTVAQVFYQYNNNAAYITVIYFLMITKIIFGFSENIKYCRNQFCFRQQ